MEFQPLHSASELDSPLNHGWGYTSAVLSAAVLLFAIAPYFLILATLIGLR